MRAIFPLRWFAFAALFSIAATDLQSPPKLDPKDDHLTMDYIQADRIAKYGYLDVDYPKAWAQDGLGSLKTKPIIQQHSQSIDDDLREALRESVPSLEQNPRDKDLLGRIVRVMGERHFQTRIVPFADRFIAAGGKLDYDATEAYVGGLARLGRTREAEQQYYASAVRFGSMSVNIAGQLYGARFSTSWLIERDFKGMLEAFRDGMVRGLFPGDANFIQDTLCNLLANAGERQDLPWFAARMEHYWIWFNEPRLRSVLEIFRKVRVEAPEALTLATDPLFRGSTVPPEALEHRAVDSLNRGDSELAVKQAERAVDLAKASSLGQHFSCLTTLTRVLRQRGELEHAFAATEEVEHLAARINEEPERGWALYMKGMILERLADFRGAADCYAQSMRLGEKLRYTELYYSSKSNMARALAHTGFAAQAEPALREIAEKNLKRRLLAEIPASFEVLGDCLLEMRHYSEALTAFRQAVAPVKEAGADYNIELAVRIGCLRGIAACLLEQHQNEEAEKAFDDYAAAVKNTASSSYDWVWQLGKARCRRALKDSAGAERLIHQCLATIDAERASLKDFSHRRTLNDNKYAAYELAIELALERGDGDAAFGIAERSRARAFLDAMGVYSGDLRPRPTADLASLIHTSSDLCTVVYYQLPDRVLGWVVAEGKAQLVTIEIPERTLQGIVEEFMSGIYFQSILLKDKSRALRGVPNAMEASKKLYETIWAPIEAKLPPGRRTCIIPHQVLHYLPFQALHDGTTFLIEHRELLTAPSASALVDLRERSPQPEGPLLVLDPILTDDPKSPFSRTESQGLKAQFPEGKFILMKDATLGAFRENAPNSGIIHVSSHGYYNPWVPLESGLVFAGPNGKPALLTSKDVYSLKLNRTQLIVMSACVSSVGDFAKGDEVTGITRAFQVAGIPNVIGSLWPVENDATIELMTNFHRSLAESHHPATALRQAQMALISKNVTIARWAPFELTGSGQALVH